MVLVVGAGLLINSFMRVRAIHLGFEPEHLILMNVQLSLSKAQGQKGKMFYGDLLKRIDALPGVQSTGATSSIFIEGTTNPSILTIEGRAASADAEQVEVSIDSVTPNYFHAMGVRLLSGREFNDHDDSDSFKVAIINETFARRFWAGEDPIGKRFRMGSSVANSSWLTVSGVVADMRRSGFNGKVKTEAFLPYTQMPFIGFMTLVVRSATEPQSTVAAIRSEIRAMDRNQPVTNVKTMDQVLDEMIAQRRFNTLLLGVFAAVALLLAAIGIYSLVSFSVTQRTHEIGVRLALGAQSSDILRLVMGQGILLAFFGVSFGIVAALVVTRLLSNLLYGISATDPLTFVTTGFLLMIVTLGACYCSARRAMKVDPIIALRYE
jgi:putative ABC transport system permease protein